METLDRTIQVLGGQSWAAQDFIRFLRSAQTVNVMACLFPEFSIYYFRIVVDHG